MNTKVRAFCALCITFLGAPSFSHSATYNSSVAYSAPRSLDFSAQDTASASVPSPTVTSAGNNVSLATLVKDALLVRKFKAKDSFDVRPRFPELVGKQF